MVLRGPFAVSILLLSTLASIAGAQSASQSQPGNTPSDQPYTIRTISRVVLTDVTVTDKNGNPVHGLPQSAFQIFDNNKPQTMASFEEHTATPGNAQMEPVAAGKGVYSNDYLAHLPPVISVIIIDIANLDVPDQMYLYYELNKFLKEQPLDQPLALYLRAGNGCFLVQNFTSDRELLLTALRKAIPRIPPTGREYLSDIDTLRQMTVYLSQLPGRKNILWFAGGSTLYLRDDFAFNAVDPAAWRDLYDELEQERIAVYPIDARGLMNLGLRTSVWSLLWYQHVLMSETARATGGQAFYDNNGLLEITSHILNSDGSFYTLTYAPQDFHFDNKWHKVRVKLNVDGYQLSYRRGYFADGSLGGEQRPQETKTRTRLMPNGEKVELPDLRSVPIIFQARVLPTSDPAVTSAPKPSGSIAAPPPRKGTVPFSIRYSLPVSTLTQQTVDGKRAIVLGVAAIVLNNDGRAVDRQAEKVTMTVNEDAVRANPGAQVSIDRQLNLKKDDRYLYLAVWDMTSGRLGTLQVPLQVSKPAKSADRN